VQPLLLFLALASTCGWAATEYKNPDFELKLGSDWTRTVLIGAEHLYFSSKRADVSIKADSGRMKNKVQDPYKAAQVLIEKGIKRESDENKTGWATITKQGISKFRDGVQATYSGRDGTQRSFTWVGFIKEDKVVYLYFETPTRNELRLAVVVEEVLEGFRY